MTGPPAAAVGVDAGAAMVGAGGLERGMKSS